MTQKKRYLGKWELGCIVFNSCLYKIFTTYPRRFSEISGSASYLTALYTGILFLIGLYLVLRILKKYSVRDVLFRPNTVLGKVTGRLLRVLLAVYWLLSAAYALREFTAVLHNIAYTRSPNWFLMAFFLAGAAVTAFCGGKAVYRMHSLMVVWIGLGAAAIALLGLKYAEPLYLAPLLGNGADSVFGMGLSTLFLYTDSILIFQLIPRSRPDCNSERAVMTGAALAVACNVALVLAAAMSQPASMEFVSAIPIYPLTKAAYFGKFWSRMDAVYLIAFLLSGFLYLSMALHLLVLAIGEKRPKFSKTHFGVGALCLFLCLSLTGCYDGREVEEEAYAIALGVDKGEQARYCYTFQLSNPLELGSSMDETEKKEEQTQGEEQKKEQENKTVNNISVEADDFYLALNKLKSYLSKEPELSHIKVIVFSEEAARDGILEQASLLFQQQQIRPSANVCLAESAREFLNRVKPTLEESTARYYELLFQNRNSPYAPVTELREFVARGTDDAWDPVLPVADEEKLSGMGVFQNGTLVEIMDGKQAMLYKLLAGQAHEIAVRAGDSSFLVTGTRRPEIQVDWTASPQRILVKTNLKARLIYGRESDSPRLAADLEEQMTEFLQDTLRDCADVLGIGSRIRAQTLSGQEWKTLSWQQNLSVFSVFSQTHIKLI